MNDLTSIATQTETARTASAPPQGSLAAGPMARAWARVLGRLLKLPLHETRVATRGFSVESAGVVRRLEGIGASFAAGYNPATSCTALEPLLLALQAVPAEDAGFAFEGAAMGLALSDWMTPGRHRFDAFMAGPAQPHEYMAWVGLGWALARLPGAPLPALQCYASINKWLALDGYGFHEGYFDWPRSVRLQRRPKALTGLAACVFDQGLGRSLWFVCGARPAAIEAVISSFASTRQSDL